MNREVVEEDDGYSRIKEEDSPGHIGVGWVGLYGQMEVPFQMEKAGLRGYAR